MSFTQIEDAKFYSNDTDASLVFIPHEDTFNFETAKVVMFNRDDESLVERDAVVTTENGRKVASYELPEEIISHWGEWIAQPVFISGGEIYSGAIVPFSVERYLMQERTPKLTEVVTVTKFVERSQELVNAMIQAEAQRITEEQVRQDSEANRVQAESERSENFDNVFKGKNYLEGVDLVDGYFVDDTNGELAEFATHSVTDFINLIPGQKYVFSNTAGELFANSRIVFYDESNTYINGYRINGGAQIEEFEFTAPNNATKARISLQRTGSPDYSTWNIRVKDYKIITTLDMVDIQPRFVVGEGLNLDNNELQLDKYYGSKGIITEGDLNTIDGQGTYLYVQTEGKELLNRPPIPTSFTLEVTRAQRGWVTQVAKQLNASITYERTLRITDHSGAENISRWEPIGTIDIFPYLTETDDLDNFYHAGKIVAINPINAPEPNTGWAVVNREVRSLNQDSNFWTVQHLTEIRPTKGVPPKVYSRIMQITNGELHSVGSYTRLDNVYAPGFFRNNGTHSSGDVNQFTEPGIYLLIGGPTSTLINKPFESSGLLIVFKSNGDWTVQMAVENASGKFYYRTFRTLPDGGIDNASDWIDVGRSTEGTGGTGDTGGSSDLSGETWVNLGDSIFGNTRNSTSVSNQIAERTGATVVNIGFGGSRIAKHLQYWDAFSFYHLAEEIVKGETDPTKWVLQDEAVAKMKNGELSGMPTYFEQHLNDLKAIDWAEVDGVTVAGGTNDYTASVPTDNIENLEDTTTYAGALRYGMKLLMTKYPHLKVLLCTPMYRFWRDSEGNVIDDSDTREYAGQTLPDFVEKAKEVGKELKIPVLDNYFELGINEFNRTLYFPENDGTHPNPTGNRKLGYKIGSALISEF